MRWIDFVDETGPASQEAIDVLRAKLLESFHEYMTTYHCWISTTYRRIGFQLLKEDQTQVRDQILVLEKQMCRELGVVAWHAAKICRKVEYYNGYALENFRYSGDVRLGLVEKTLNKICGKRGKPLAKEAVELVFHLFNGPTSDSEKVLTDYLNLRKNLEAAL